jgi:hypothetical protein
LQIPKCGASARMLRRSGLGPVTVNGVRVWCITGRPALEVGFLRGHGRADGNAEHADEIGEVQYSALLDVNTFESCAAADGETGATPDDIQAVPNPDCDGGDKCRCVRVYVFADEVQ